MPRAVDFTMWFCSHYVGRGAMAEVGTIVESVKKILGERDLPAQN